MAWTGISNTVPQYEENGIAASGFYIKFYASGTVTPIPMAIDSTGVTTLAKCVLSTEGYPLNGSSAVFIPHIDQLYKIILYRNAADADADTTANAAWIVDALDPVLTSDSIFANNYQEIRDIASADTTIYARGQLTVGDEGESFFQKITGAAPGFYVDNNVDVLVPSGGDGSIGWVRRSIPIESYDTVALALADTKKAVLGGFFAVKDYATGNNSGVLFFSWVAAATGTDDGGSFIDHDTLPIQAQQNFQSTHVTIAQFGAKTGTDSTTAINAALATGKKVEVGAGTFNTSSRLIITAQGQNFKASGSFGQTVINYTGAASGTIIGTSGSTLLNNVVIDGFRIESTNIDGVVGIDTSNMSYSSIKNNHFQMKGNNCVGIFGQGHVNGDRPYYNEYHKNDMGFDNSSGGTTGSKGYFLQRVVAADHIAVTRPNYNGPNACVISDGRISSSDRGIVISDGVGISCNNVTMETIIDAHYDFGESTPDSNGTFTGLGTVNTISISSGTYSVNAYAGGTVKITGGTGAVQTRLITSNTATTFTVSPYWNIVPDNTSTFELLAVQGAGCSITNPYAEGDSISLPDFLRTSGAFAGTMLTGGSIGSVGDLINSPVFRNDERLNPNWLSDPFTISFSRAAVANSSTTSLLPAGGTIRTNIGMTAPFHVISADITMSGGAMAGTAQVKITGNGASLSGANDINLDPNSVAASGIGPVKQIFFAPEQIQTASIGVGLGVDIITDASWTSREVIITLTVQLI